MSDDTGGERRQRERRHGDRRRVVEVRPTYVRIDAAALTGNLAAVDRAVGERVRTLAVVKADGYGHGAVEVARTFVDAGAWGLAVSLIEEGVELRQAGVHAPVLVLGGVHAGSQDVVVHRNLVPVVWTRSHLELLAGAVHRAGAPPLRVHLKIDTGMSRLGVVPDDLAAVLDAFDGDGGATVVLDGVMTHLALADETDDASDVSSRASVAAFSDCCALIRSRGFRPRFRHVCNSAGVARFERWHLDMVRPGIALYGAASSRDVELAGVRTAMSWHSSLLGVQRRPAGTSVSYGHRVTLARDSVLGIVPVGYGDGYRRSMSGQAEVLIRGHRCPVLGNITMDVSMVDVTDIPDARDGERVTLMGRQGRDQISVYELARWGGVLPYEVMCGISKRVPRHWG